jgi:hypothetical protein
MIKFFCLNSSYAKKKLNNLLKQHNDLHDNDFFTTEDTQSFYEDTNCYGFSLFLMPKLQMQEFKVSFTTVKIVFLKNDIIFISKTYTQKELNITHDDIINIENFIKYAKSQYIYNINLIRQRCRAFERQIKIKHTSPKALNDMRKICFKFQSALSEQSEIMNEVCNNEISNKKAIKNFMFSVSNNFARNIYLLIEEIDFIKDDYIFINNIRFTRSMHLLSTVSVVMFPLHILSNKFTGNGWMIFNILILVVIVAHIVKFRIEDKRLLK